MLFHLSMTHRVEDCPGYNQKTIPGLITAVEQLDKTAQQFHVKVHFWLDGLPEHVMYALLEANDPSSIAFFMASFPLRQDVKITPVERMQDVAAKAKPIFTQR